MKKLRTKLIKSGVNLEHLRKVDKSQMPIQRTHIKAEELALSSVNIPLPTTKSRLVIITEKLGKNINRYF